MRTSWGRHASNLPLETGVSGQELIIYGMQPVILPNLFYPPLPPGYLHRLQNIGVMIVAYGAE